VKLKFTRSDAARMLPALEQLATGVAMLDSGLRFASANAAFCELFDIGSPKLREISLADFGRAGQVLQPIAERARSLQTAVASRGERIITASGHVFSADIIASAVEGGVLLEVHRIGPEGAVGGPPSRLSESLRGLAHEVKNPLAGIRGAAQLLRRRLAEPELARLADMIMTEADRLANLADRLLHGGRKPHLTSVNLHEVTERARAVIASEAAPSVQLDRDYDPSLPGLRGDADRLLQLLLNLMRNALQAGASRVTLRTRAAHNVLIGDRPARLVARVDIIDNGRGVPETLRENLFLPLVSGQPDGTGLGLALAQEIAREHGGVVVHEGHDGRTVFAVLLPLGGEHG
jgi:two-component system, NtrC family, nitrogen regulation sensor histidine kinase GlnL